MQFRAPVWRVGIALLGVAVFVVGCAAPGDRSSSSTSVKAALGSSGTAALAAPAPTASPKLPVLATGSPAAPKDSNDPDTKGLSAEINSMHRDSSGLLTMTWTLINNGDESFDTFNDLADSQTDYFGGSIANVQLIDQTQQVRFHPLFDQHGYCACSSGDGTLAAGSRITLYNIYKVSPSTKSVDITILGFQPIKNVPIS